MKVSKDWLRELVDLKISDEELVRLLPMRTIGLKEVTDKFIELDMKGYNRADLLGMRGVAFEVAAITNSQVNFTEVDNYIWTERNLKDLKVEIENPKLCKVYCVAKIEKIKVAPSPKNWVKKLEDSGIRSINNIVDITNLCMLEFGQTMHSFDGAKVKDETMIIRNAKKGERLITIDGKDRELSEDDLLITDPENILSMSGIMGGKDSEVSESTNSILLEVAIFDPILIRKSTQRHNLYSEASKRIQHGLTVKRMLQALDAAIKMYEQMGGVLTAISITGDLKDEHKKVNLRHQKLNSLVGVNFKKEEVENYLQSLGFHLEGVATNSWEVTVPYWRLDINIEEDLIEEVARIYGYEKIPPKKLEGKSPQKIDQGLQDLIYKLKASFSKVGLTEVQSYSFYSSETLQALGWTPELSKKHLVKVANPISSETEYMRMNIWPNLVDVVEKNIGYKQSLPSDEGKDIAIFEIGKVYYISSKDNLPRENYRLAIALMDSTNNPLPETLAIFEKVVKGLKLNIKSKSNPATDGHQLFHPVRHLSILKGEDYIGGIAEVHPRVLHTYGVEKRVAIVEIDLEPLL